MLKKLNADFVSFPGHKGLLGPIGTGFLYCSDEAINKLEPMNYGGGTVIDVTEENFISRKCPCKI